MEKGYLVVFIFLIILSILIAGCTVNVGTPASSSPDSRSLRYLYENGITVPDNKPFLDKDRNCVVFHNGVKTICGPTEKSFAEIDAATE